MKKRLVSAGVIALAAALSGPAALAAAAPADEQQIRDIVAGEAAAIKSLDNAKLSTFFCDKFRGVVASKTADDQIPPLSQVAGYGPQMISAVASAAGVSGPTTQALTTAIQNNDDKAYRSSFHNAAREVLSGRCQRGSWSARAPAAPAQPSAATSGTGATPLSYAWWIRTTPRSIPRISPDVMW
ncbi:Hypothetical protein ERS075547_05915 [Mycobacteroides abscessus]|nr:Hypothetical protein ERS075547_05915 [Mycobacteroides abscessus]